MQLDLHNFRWRSIRENAAKFEIVSNFRNLGHEIGPKGLPEAVLNTIRPCLGTGKIIRKMFKIGPNVQYYQDWRRLKTKIP